MDVLKRLWRMFRMIMAACPLDEGDLVEFSRTLFTYSHWAVYIGNGRVIHFGGEPGVDKSNASIREDDFEVVRNGDPFTVNNRDGLSIKLMVFFQFMEFKRPFPPHEIVERAKAMLGQTGYNLLFNNCEHFANYCRYGVATSEQVDVLGRGVRPFQIFEEPFLLR